ncbi:MAG: type II toxin-antitoxin system MqsA family antitoxin [Deltaproteobacteria bacterium]|nr:type II toxin-antitoxin system MqsA family antitoxin [Deltaproteobacteria bacterium]
MNSAKRKATVGKARATESCYFCRRGVLERRRVTVDFRWGDELTVIENVPATVCNECGEQYYAANVVRQMERFAKARRCERELRVPVATMR